MFIMDWTLFVLFLMLTCWPRDILRILGWNCCNKIGLNCVCRKWVELEERSSHIMQLNYFDWVECLQPTPNCAMRLMRVSVFLNIPQLHWMFLWMRFFDRKCSTLSIFNNILFVGEASWSWQVEIVKEEVEEDESSKCCWTEAGMQFNVPAVSGFRKQAALLASVNRARGFFI